MKIAEKFTDETMFTIINNSLDWSIKLPAKNLYLLYISKYGFRELSSVFNDTDIELIMTSIADMYKDKWNNLHSKLLEELLPAGGNETENFTETTTENNTTTTSDNENTTTKVSAYNVDDFANDENNTTVKDGNTMQDNTKTHEYTKTKSNNSSIKLVGEYFNLLSKNNICDIIFTDINNVISTRVISLD